MKYYIFALLLFTINGLYGQDKIVPKPEYVIIIKNEIVSQAKVDEYGESGFIKSMSKGVTQEYRDSLVTKFGDKIGDKEFVVLISLFTEEEKLERSKQTNESLKIKDKGTEKNEFLVSINDAAKDFKVEMVDGTVLKLSELKGKVILINFWATWCAPCLMEFYNFPSKIIRPFKDSNFVLLAISMGETKEKVVQKMKSLKGKGIDFNVGLDPTESIWSLYGEGGIPKNFVIDKNGIVKYTSTGYLDDNVDKIANEIRKLLL